MPLLHVNHVVLINISVKRLDPQFEIDWVDPGWSTCFQLPLTVAVLQKMVDRKAVIKNADMSEDMQQDAIDCATQALEKYNIEKDIAAYIKKEFDKKYNPTWHCIVGRNFGSYVTHETKHFIYFYLGQVAILLFKSG
ncbi:dynein light chain type 1 [Ostertagia ostertagi]